MSDRSQVEETLRQIPGVLSARVLGDGDDLAEIHVLSDGDRHPKQVARDVESCLAAKFGVDVDHRRISVAQVEPEDPHEARLAIDSIQVKLQNQMAEVEVSLTWGARACLGKAAGPASFRHRLLLVAEATLRAVQDALGEELSLVVEDVGRYEVAREAAIASLVTLADDRSEEPLVGCAFVRRDEAEATVRATLAGLNRRLGFFLKGDASL